MQPEVEVKLPDEKVISIGTVMALTAVSWSRPSIKLNLSGHTISTENVIVLFQSLSPSVISINLKGTDFAAGGRNLDSVRSLCAAMQEKTFSVHTLDLSNNRLGPQGCSLLASGLSVCASLTVADLRYNELDTEVATMLLEIAKEKKISLCGIKPGQTEADFTPVNNNGNRMKPADAILLTADLAVITSLTEVCQIRKM